MKNNIILFDDLCVLCNWAVNFVLKRDSVKKYKFASLQSQIGIELCEQHNIDTKEIDSIVLIKNGKAFIKSAAILEILKDTPIGWRLLRIGRILPKSFLDWLYDVIAKHRYKIFGKKDELAVPSEDLTDRFL